LDGPGGLSAGPFPATLGTTLGIDETESVQVVLDKRLPAGPWDARIVLHSGLLEHTGRATITFPAAGIAAPVTVSRVSRGWFYLAIGLIVALLTALGAVLVMIARRRLGPAPTI
jgi:hypothetical protein